MAYRKESSPEVSNKKQTQSPPTQVAAETGYSAGSATPDELNAEAAEIMRRTFEEIGSSSFRIAKSLERLNLLAQETYCELDATRKALLLRG